MSAATSGSTGSITLRLGPTAGEAADRIEALPPEACPDGLAIVGLALAPECHDRVEDHVRKSETLHDLLAEAGFEVVGSRPMPTAELRRPRSGPGILATTTVLLCRCRRETVRLLAGKLEGLATDPARVEAVALIEEVAVPDPGRKLDEAVAGERLVHLEGTFYRSPPGCRDVERSFRDFHESIGIEPRIHNRIAVMGAVYMSFEVPGDRIQDVLPFAPLRSLRPIAPLVLRRTAA